MTALKKSIITFVIYGIIGIVLITFGLISHSEGLITSFGFAILAASVVKLIRLAGIAKNPEKAKRYENTQKDERYVMLLQRSGHYTFLISAFAGIIAAFIMTFMGMEQVAGIVMNIVALEVLLFGIISIVMYRKY